MLLSCLSASMVASPAWAGGLDDVYAALGAESLASVHLSTRAEVEGPEHTFRTDVVALSDGTTRMVQASSPDRRTALLVDGEGVWAQPAPGEPLVEASAAMRSFVRGHEVHRLLLDLPARFEEGRRSRGRCRELVHRPDAQPARLCHDEGNLPVSLRLSVHPELGGGHVELTFGDWREVMGARLPYEVTFRQGRDRFVYRFTEVLPFTTAPGLDLPDDPLLRLARLGDLAEIASMHHRVMEAHRHSDVDLLLADAAAQGVQIHRGRVTRIDPGTTRARLGPYLAATRFDRYEDVVPPVISVSHDGTLGWLACEMEASGTVHSDEVDEPVRFGFAWVELVARQTDGWRRLGTASSPRPDDP